MSGKAPADPLDRLKPEEGDGLRVERWKGQLAATLAQQFIDANDGRGLSKVLEAMVEIATNPKVRQRTRALTAGKYVQLAIKAAQSGLVGPKVAQQFNIGGAGGAPRPEGEQPHDRAFYDAMLATPEGRALMIEKLRAATGVPSLPALPPPGVKKRAAPSANGHAPGKRNGRANGRAAT